MIFQQHHILLLRIAFKCSHTIQFVDCHHIPFGDCQSEANKVVVTICYIFVFLWNMSCILYCSYHQYDISRSSKVNTEDKAAIVCNKCYCSWSSSTHTMQLTSFHQRQRDLHVTSLLTNIELTFLIHIVHLRRVSRDMSVFSISLSTFSNSSCQW